MKFKFFITNKHSQGHQVREVFKAHYIESTMLSKQFVYFEEKKLDMICNNIFGIKNVKTKTDVILIH